MVVKRSRLVEDIEVVRAPSVEEATEQTLDELEDKGHWLYSPQDGRDE